MTLDREHGLGGWVPAVLLHAAEAAGFEARLVFGVATWRASCFTWNRDATVAVPFVLAADGLEGLGDADEYAQWRRVHLLDNSLYLAVRAEPLGTELPQLNRPFSHWLWALIALCCVLHGFFMNTLDSGANEMLDKLKPDMKKTHKLLQMFIYSVYLSLATMSFLKQHSPSADPFFLRACRRRTPRG
jgi:hypothetical protein